VHGLPAHAQSMTGTPERTHCASAGRVAASVLDERNLQASSKTMQFP
jgi:hypothetical protein